MAKIEDILGGGEAPKPKTPIIANEDKISAVPASGPEPTDIPKVDTYTTPTAESNPETVEAPKRASTYEDLLAKFSTYEAPTPEQLDKERKKQKRNETISALSDGISAIANLGATIHGAPNMHTGDNTQSEHTRVSYQRMLDNRDKQAYNHYMMLLRARQADDQLYNNQLNVYHNERSWQRQIGMDNKADKQRAEDVEYRDRQNKMERKFKKSQAKAAQDQFEQELDVKRQSNAIRAKANSDSKATNSPKQIGFADSKGSTIAIDENVWAGSKNQVFNVMVEDLKISLPQYFTEAQKEAYVKQHWHESEKASKLMLEYSKYHTATTPSQINRLNWSNTDNEETDWEQ